MPRKNKDNVDYFYSQSTENEDTEYIHDIFRETEKLITDLLESCE